MTLLAPPSTSGNQPVSVVGAGELAARDLIAWLRGDAPLPGQEASANMHWTLPEWFIEMQNALSASDIQWQQEMQFEREKLESDNRALINQADRLTETARRQAETIEILVRKLAELGVEVRRAPRGDG